MVKQQQRSKNFARSFVIGINYNIDYWAQIRSDHFRNFPQVKDRIKCVNCGQIVSSVKIHYARNHLIYKHGVRFILFFWFLVIDYLTVIV